MWPWWLEDLEALAASPYNFQAGDQYQVPIPKCVLPAHFEANRKNEIKN